LTEWLFGGIKKVKAGNKKDMKGLFCFSLLLVFIFPLFNIQQDDIFSINGLSELYFVKITEGKQQYEKQEKTEFSLNELKDLEGVIMTFEGKEIEEVSGSLNVKLIKEERVDDMEIIYGYTDMYNDSIILDGKKANVQMLKSQDKVIVGLPIILSGF